MRCWTLSPCHPLTFHAFTISTPRCAHHQRRQATLVELGESGVVGVGTQPTPASSPLPSQKKTTTKKHSTPLPASQSSLPTDSLDSPFSTDPSKQHTERLEVHGSRTAWLGLAYRVSHKRSHRSSRLRAPWIVVLSRALERSVLGSARRG